MSITSFEFLFFILISLIVYHLVPARFQWIVLLIASVTFYVSFSIIGIFVLITTALIIWFFALKIQEQKNKLSDWLKENKKTAEKEVRKAKKAFFEKKEKGLLAIAVSISVFLLLLCKYYGTFAWKINSLLHTNMWTAENILLPLGISYYSLQLIGYIADVQRDVIEAEKNPLKIILYGMFFLSIMQGPFNRYGELMPQMVKEEKNRLDVKQIKMALFRVLWGYVKKMCIADQVGILANEVFSNYTQYSGLGIVFGIVCFAVQLYADFSGYMDIIVGIGQLFEIKMPENFRQPFFSRNMSEFWRRWHITLGAWLKDYVLYPILKSKGFKNMGKKMEEKLGKNAGRIIPVYIADLILWILIGAWHGAGFNYVFGVGILQFIYIFIGEITENIRKKNKEKFHINEESIAWRVLRGIKVTVLMMFAWIFFNSASMGDATAMIGRIFADGFGMWQITDIFAGKSALAGTAIRNFMAYIVLCLVSLFVVDIVHEKEISIGARAIEKGYAAQAGLVIVLLFALVVFGAYGSQYSASNFIYFEF